MEMDTVDIIIVNHNSGKLLGKALACLQHQSVSPSQIWVIDNASSDGSAKCAAAYVNVTLIQESKNLGFAAANNLAMTRSDSTLIALLNPDAFPAHDWLEQLLNAASYYPNVTAFGSRQLCHHDTSLLDGIGDTYHISGLVWRTRHTSKQSPKDFIPREIFSPCAAAALYRRSALEEVNFFDEDYFCYVEDVDLGFRLRLAGYTAQYVPNAVVTHIGSGTTGGKQSDFSIYYGHRNLVWTYIKNMPFLLFWLFLPLHFLLNLYSIVFFLTRGKGKIIIRAKLDAFKGLPRAWRKRQKIQKHHKVSMRKIWSILDKRLYPSSINRKQQK